MSMTEIVKVFGERKIRSVWDDTAEEWYFSAVDVVAVLTESADPRNYWKVLKNRLKKEGNQTVTNCNQLKLKAADGKFYKTDVATPEQMFRLIQSIPSPKAEPFKIWMAKVAAERLNQLQDPELSIQQALADYRRLGYSERWIARRTSHRSTRRTRVRSMWTLAQLPCREMGYNTEAIGENEMMFNWQKGGLSYATNDIARLEASIAACKERIAKAKGAAREKELADRARRDNTQRALGLLAADDGESKYVENAVGEAARRQFVGRVRSRMTQTAPDVNSNYVAAVKSVEARFKVALIDMTNAARWSSGWKAGNGRSCILIFLPGGMFGQRMGYYEKYDAEGRLVMISKDRADFEELKALDSELSDKSRSRSDEAAVGQMNLKSLLTEKH